MKLSKAQQEVVDKMREGWIFKKGNFNGCCWIINPHDQHLHSITVSKATFKALYTQDVIHPTFHSKSIHEPDIYQLTEKYRSNDK